MKDYREDLIMDEGLIKCIYKYFEQDDRESLSFYRTHNPKEYAEAERR